jgi:ABC-2 type transport system ATP-binding protein
MLQLVRRLSTELGIAVLMSSHVLEDIARTCDAVVVLRDGRVAVKRPIDREDRDAPHSVHVRISGEPKAFLVAVERRGARLEDQQEDVLVLASNQPEGLPDVVRDAAAEAGVGLRELRPAGPTLEDTLIEAME